jgi:thymidylate synthase (FAD)
MKDDFYLPADGDLAAQSEDNKQGRSADALPPTEAAAVRDRLRDGQLRSYKDYTGLLETGLAREIARINLPLSLYTEMYWQIDLHNLFHFLELRLGAHAQKEIRLYAQTLLDISRHVAPRCCEAFERHILGAVTFSKDEMLELKRRLAAGGSSSGKSVLDGKALARFEEKLT